MSHFIRLSTRVINKSHIVDIITTPNKYSISMDYNYITGTFFFGKWRN